MAKKAVMQQIILKIQFIQSKNTKGKDIKK